MARYMRRHSLSIVTAADVPRAEEKRRKTFRSDKGYATVRSKQSGLLEMFRVSVPKARKRRKVLTENQR